MTNCLLLPRSWPSLVFMVYRRNDLADKDAFLAYGQCALPQASVDLNDLRTAGSVSSRGRMYVIYSVNRPGERGAGDHDLPLSLMLPPFPALPTPTSQTPGLHRISCPTWFAVETQRAPQRRLFGERLVHRT